MSDNEGDVPSSAPDVIPTPPPANSPSPDDKPKEKQYALSVFPRDKPLDNAFVERVKQLEDRLGRRILVMIDSSEWKAFYPRGYFALRRNKHQLGSKPIAVLVESFGGNAKLAFQTANLLRRRCGGYYAIVPDYALSAATLFCLGAEKIYLGDDATLGPLDAQFLDDDVEEDIVSALDTVQAVEQLEDSAIEVGWKMLRFLHERTGKKYNLLLKHALHFASEITQPLFNKIDAIRYSRQSRMLKEAQDYAERLLQPKFSKDEARAIARDLVTCYATHDFVIDQKESQTIGTIRADDDREKKTVGLHVEKEVPPDLYDPLEWLAMYGFRSCGLGFVEEMPKTEAKT